MREVLSEPVRAYGVLYPSGTPLRLLPADTQVTLRLGGAVIELPDLVEAVVASEKAFTSGHDVSEETPEPGVAEAASLGSVADASGSSAPEGHALAGVATEPPPPIERTPLSTVKALPADLRAKLEAATPPIYTVEEAAEYLRANRSFRTVTGIGKVGDERVREALGL